MKRIKLLMCVMMVHLSADCATRITQRQLPFTITRPGHYILTQDLVYEGNEAAITVEAHNVYLSCTSHSITCNEESAQAIKVYNVGDVTLEGGTFVTSSEAHKSAVLEITNAQRVVIKQVATAAGLLIKDASSVLVEGSDFKDTSTTVHNGSQVTFKDTVFNGGQSSLIFKGRSTDGKVLNCSFLNAENTLLWAQEIDGLLIKNCSFADSGTQAVLLGFPKVEGEATRCTSTRIEGSTFINTTQPQEGILFYEGSGLIVESCLFDLVDGFHNGAIHLERATSNSAIRGCTFKGAAMGIVVGSSNTLIEDCVVTGAKEAGISCLLFSSDCTIRNCNLSGNTVGISLNGSSHVITESSFSDNRLSGMEVDGKQQSITRATVANNKTGVYLSASSCALLDNVIASNTEEGIVIKGEHNALERNTVYNNGGIGIVRLADNAHVENNTEYNNKTI